MRYQRLLCIAMFTVVAGAQSKPCEKVAFVIRSDDSGSVRGSWIDLNRGGLKLEKGSAVCRDSRIQRGDPKSPNDALRLRVRNGDQELFSCDRGDCNGESLPLNRLLSKADLKPGIQYRKYDYSIRGSANGWRPAVLLEGEPMDTAPMGLSGELAWCPNYHRMLKCPDRPAAATVASELKQAPGLGLHRLMAVITLPNGTRAYGPASTWVLVLPKSAAPRRQQIAATLVEMEAEGSPREAVGFFLAFVAHP